jgi:hypothetical protein
MRLGTWAAGIIMASFTLVAAARAQPSEPDAFLVVEVGASGPMNSPLTEQFLPGAEASLGFYAAFLPELAVGLRVRAGLLSAGTRIPQDPVDRDVLDYGVLAAALRLRPFASLEHDAHSTTGLVLELAPAASILDGSVVAAYEVAIGYGIAVDSIVLAPVVRFTHFLEGYGRFGGNHLAAWMVGVEMIVDPPRRE